MRFRKTLQFRLAAWNAILVIATAAITLLGLRFGLKWALIHEMDKSLLEDIQEISLGLRELKEGEFPQFTDDLTRKALGHQHHDWYVRLYERDGRLIWQSPVPSDLPAARSPGHMSPRTVGNYRLAQSEVEVADGKWTVQVGAQLTSVYADLAHIDRLVLLAVAFLLVCAPLLGYWFARRAAASLGEIIRTAARLRPDQIDERLPERGTGDELDQLAQTVNGLLQRIAVHLEEKRDFLANAAHELRTPLAAIHSSVEVALNTDRSREEYQELLVDLMDQTVSLETIVNQLLLILESEAEQLKAPHDVVALDEVVQRSTEMFSGVADSRGVDLVLEECPPLRVLGRAHLLRQMINNLIDNAIKYTPPGGRVDVSLSADTHNGSVVLTVSDTGIGIPAEDVPRVFDRFYRGDRSRSRVAEAVGTGLGLSICKAVAAAHGGTVECVSRVGHGTTMTARLPLIRQDSPVPATVGTR